jgi:hypothetical protein
MSVEKNLSEALDIDHVPAVIEEPKQMELEIIEPPKELHMDHQDEDYLLVRKTLRNLINKGNDAIEEISQIARANESARGFEVVANLIKTVGETSKDLYNLQKTKRELKEPEGNKKLDETTITVDKAVFVGTTADLLKSLKQKDNEE